MKYKYEEFISNYEDCTIFTCAPENRIAYRWTFNSIKNINNFTPRYLTSAYEHLPKKDCVGYSLSMFDNEHMATKRLDDICARKKLLYKKLGTHLSKGVIKENDGVCSKSDVNGHFSFFEAEGVDLSCSFSVIKQLMP